MNDKERNIWVEYKEKTPPSHTVLQKEIQSVIDGRQI